MKVSVFVNGQEIILVPNQDYTLNPSCHVVFSPEMCNRLDEWKRQRDMIKITMDYFGMHEEYE